MHFCIVSYIISGPKGANFNEPRNVHDAPESCGVFAGATMHVVSGETMVIICV